MAINPLAAALPNAPLLDAAGNLTPAWRAFFQALVARTGGTLGASSGTTQAALNAEVANRIAGDNALGATINTMQAALEAETAQRIAVESDLAGRDVLAADQAIANIALSFAAASWGM